MIGLAAINNSFWLEKTLDMSNFAARLKKLRTERGLSQAELAKLVGVHYNHIGRYERSQSKPSADVLGRLADVLTVSTDYLMEGNKSTSAKANFQDHELLMQFKEIEKLNPTDKRLVKEFLNAFLTKRKLEAMLKGSN